MDNRGSYLGNSAKQANPHTHTHLGLKYQDIPSLKGKKNVQSQLSVDSWGTVLSGFNLEYENLASQTNSFSYF